MKVHRHEKIGLSLIFMGTIAAFISFYWSPLILLAIGLILVGGLLWNPLDFFVS